MITTNPTKYFTANEMTAKADIYQHTITFSNLNTWVMRITADRRIEVNEGVAVSEAAQAIFDALKPMLKKPWVGLTDEEEQIILASSFSKESAMYTAIAKLKDKNGG